MYLEHRPFSQNEPVSFHLGQLLGNNFKLPTGMSSADVLRSPFKNKKDQSAFRSSDEITEPPKKTVKNVKTLKSRAAKLLRNKQFNPAGVTMEMWVKKLKVKNDKGKIEWQPRLLVVSNKRLFILMKKDETSVLDIVDSIPMQEIESVSKVGADELQRRTSSRRLSVHSFTDKTIRSIDSLRSTLRNWIPKAKLKTNSDFDSLKEKSEVLQKKYDELLTADGVDSASSGILRITTKHGGFNEGQPYYFSHIQELRTTGSDARHTSIGDEPHSVIDVVEGHISKLSHAYKQVFAIETRFQRLQAGLRSTWNSLPFNMIILALIVSNFIFTVKGMENTDPANDGFYERLDLIYTIIFSIGPSSTSPFAAPAMPDLANLRVAAPARAICDYGHT